MPGENFTISHVNIWLLRFCSAPQTACRLACMKLFAQFLPLQKGLWNIYGWRIEIPNIWTNWNHLI